MHEGDGMGAGPSERATHAGGDGPAPRRRMSARRKQDAVLRLLRGEDLELVSRGLGVTAAELSGWRDAFLAGGEASLKSRPADARDAEIGRLRAKAGEVTARGELLRARSGRGGRPDRGPPGVSRGSGGFGRLETARPLARRKVGAMSRQVSPSTAKA